MTRQKLAQLIIRSLRCAGGITRVNLLTGHIFDVNKSTLNY